jgi:hypothetical protein
MKTPINTEETTLESVDSNQTFFSSEEPLFEKNALPVDPAMASATGPTPRKKPPILFLALGALGVVMVIVIVAAVMLPQPVRQQLMAQPSPTPVSTAELNDQQRRIQELQGDLRLADPTQLDLPFPQVRMGLTIQQEKNR